MKFIYLPLAHYHNFIIVVIGDSDGEFSTFRYIFGMGVIV
jgi:hypothetical protein